MDQTDDRLACATSACTRRENRIVATASPIDGLTRSRVCCRETITTTRTPLSSKNMSASDDVPTQRMEQMASHVTGHPTSSRNLMVAPTSYRVSCRTEVNQ
jgi:hypothetical protein